MTLRYEPDVSVADWFVAADADWRTLAVQGPPSFDSYATIWFDHGESESYRSDDEIMAVVVDIAAGFTRTPENVFFGLWDGWGELSDGARQYTLVQANWMRDLMFAPTPPNILPAFDDEILSGPKIDLHGERDYLLFHGAAADVGQWGARPLTQDIERTLPPASLTWPADHSWFIAADVDPSWLCVGGSGEFIDAALAHPDLDAEPAIYGEVPPLEFEER